MAKQLIVAAIIVDDAGQPTRVLAARRSYPPDLAGRWEFPGGKVEDGEAPLAALRRELTEELGGTATVGAELQPVNGTAWPLSQAYEMRTWFATLRGADLTVSDAHDELRWLIRDELWTVSWLEPDIPIVVAVMAHLAAAGEAPVRPPDGI